MHPGDILLPDQVVGYELAKVTPDGIARRYQVYRPDPELLAGARNIHPAGWAGAISAPRPDDSGGRRWPVVHVGPMLTGDKVVADRAALADLSTAWPLAIGIEMESSGVALAAYRSGTGFLMVKAVSDFAGQGKDDSWQHYAAEVAARFMVAVLEDRHGSPAVGTQPAGARPEAGWQQTFSAATGNNDFLLTVHGGPVELLSDIDILVIPQNVYFEMPPHFKESVSAAVGRISVRRSSSGETIADAVRDELRDWMRRCARPGLPVAPGTVAATTPGEMAANRIRRLYHAAITVPGPGTNDYHVEPSAVAQAVRNVLSTARAESDHFACWGPAGAGWTRPSAFQRCGRRSGVTGRKATDGKFTSSPRTGQQPITSSPSWSRRMPSSGQPQRVSHERNDAFVHPARCDRHRRGVEEPHVPELTFHRPDEVPEAKPVGEPPARPPGAVLAAVEQLRVLDEVGLGDGDDQV
jgi:Phosphorylase superfamily